MADTAIADSGRSESYLTMNRMDLRDPLSYRTPGLSCDLIMKGGITSGVVYPQAACRLATRYRLKQVGGASAGAIAAALSAAAEYHRQHSNDIEAKDHANAEPAGFVKLAAVPTDLGANLGALFQPVRATRPAHSVLMAAVAPDRSKAFRVMAAVGKLIMAAPIAFIVALILTLVPLVVWTWTSPGAVSLQDWKLLLWPALAWLPGGLIVAVLATSAWVLWRTTKALRNNGFGLTNGHSTDGREKQPPLTDWMISTIDQTAGLKKGPLTFGDLWGEHATDVYRYLRRRQAAKERLTSKDWREFKPEIDLKVMTTNLTLRKPYEFPFTSDNFYYCPQCWEAYFPADPIMNYLEKKSRPVERELTVKSDSGDQQLLMCCPRHTEEVPIRYLPDAPAMPVAIAARISLSFPGLISALPLLCIDYSRGPGRRNLITAWFSDGGIASNFPMHFFDAPWPRRPTFGLNLDKEHPDYPGEMVWRPQKALSGIFPRSHEPTTMVGFISAVVRTMQNWVDASQITMPGFRDRVTELRTGEGEGGLNLRMKKELIDKLAKRGSSAALEFADFDFSLHQWIRYRAAMNALSESFDMMDTRWHEVDNEEGYKRLIARYAGTPGDYQLAPADALADAQATEQLMAVVDQWEQAGYPATAPRVPEPKPRLRQMPPF
jgi:predicted acylesterase/phospholipase RssA